MFEIVLILIAPLVGGLMHGSQRVIRARMQNRQGPPLLQPFYDMYKLMDKRAFIVHPYHTILGILHFLTLWLVVALIILGTNLLYVIFLHLLATVFIVLAGFSVKSVFSHLGANRELLSLLAYEPIFIFLATGFYLFFGTYDISVIRENSTAIMTLPLLFIAFLLTIPLKLKLSPFDACEAHQEIVGGVEVEYSGVYFEFLYMAKWLEYIFVFSLLTLFAGDSILFAIALVAVVFLVANIVDNSTARVNIQETVKFLLIWGFGLSILNIIGLSFV
ncbi:MAG: NADH-quinone oxidoreductase subunit H [Helicobacteraceae bacterium]|nr:NADH-quinone oxidoreductase subunit H [Helicobacteraceae bacterium]